MVFRSLKVALKFSRKHVMEHKYDNVLVLSKIHVLKRLKTIFSNVQKVASEVWKR